jgi:ribosome biogenesis GTPase
MSEAQIIEPWGWNAAWIAKLAELGGTGGGEGLEPARILRQERDQFFMIGRGGELTGIVSGSFIKERGRPVTGDWVTWEPIVGDTKVLIQNIIPRRSELARQAAGEKTEKQVIAANIDWVFIVMAFDNDFNLRRLERYLRLVSARNVDAVVILNKLDQIDDPAPQIAEVKSVAGDMPIFPISAVTGQGVDALTDMLEIGHTLVCVGSSGVGKSTLINYLVGEELQATFEVRGGDDRGRHTTTQRELIMLPSGALMIDTPGIRELTEWREEDDEEGEDLAFADLEELATTCKFSDCSHKNEPGCAVLAALESGDVDADRLASYRKLQQELKDQAKRQAAADRKKEKPARGRSKRIQKSKRR